MFYLIPFTSIIGIMAIQRTVHTPLGTPRVIRTNVHTVLISIYEYVNKYNNEALIVYLKCAFNCTRISCLKSVLLGTWTWTCWQAATFRCPHRPHPQRQMWAAQEVVWRAVRQGARQERTSWCSDSVSASARMATTSLNDGASL